jgi:DNA-3-methyladenine glycosylase II
VAQAPVRLDAAGLAAAAAILAQRDDHLGHLLGAHGVPPLWHKGPGFETLVDIVLGQQVSLDSARRALVRVRAAAGAVTPEAIAAIGEEGLRGVGQTRQKARYVAGLATAVLAGDLDLEALDVLPDDEVRATLMRHVGVGRWTADIYLLMGLGRPDVWPTTDLALDRAARSLLGITPGVVPAVAVAAIAEHADRWRPYRSVAARMLWQAYLLERGRPLD